MGTLNIKHLITALLVFALASAIWPGHASASRKNAPVDSLLVYFPIISRQQPLYVFVLPTYSSYETSWGSLHIVGEVQNNLEVDLTDVQVRANLYNSRGQLLDSDFAYTLLYNLPAGEKTCFDITFLDAPSNLAAIGLEKPLYRTEGKPWPDLTLLDSDSDFDTSSGEYTINGRVRNDEDHRVECVMAAGTLYTSSGKVVGCRSSYVEDLHLDPGQRKSFEINFFGRNHSDVDSYRIQLDGNLR